MNDFDEDLNDERLLEENLEELPEEVEHTRPKKYERKVKDDVPNSESHYVDKATLYNAYVEWYAECEKAKEDGNPRPDPPRYISESIINICKNLSSRWNFANYPYRDEMVGDAIENVIRYVDRFDINRPEKNPFGYISFIASRAMVRRIKSEKMRAAALYHMIINSGVLDTLEFQDHEDGESYNSILESYQMNVNDSLANLIQPTVKKKKVRKKEEEVDIEGLLNDE